MLLFEIASPAARGEGCACMYVLVRARALHYMPAQPDRIVNTGLQINTQGGGVMSSFSPYENTTVVLPIVIVFNPLNLTMMKIA